MIKNKSSLRKREIDLSGPEGNAIYLLGTARKWAKELELDANKICSEMRSGDYEHLIQTFDKYFGTIVDLIR